MNLPNIFFVIAAAFSGMSGSALAIPIDLTSYDPQPANSGDGTITSWLAGLVADYNAANNSDLVDPGAQLFRVNSGADSLLDFPAFGKGAVDIKIPTGDYNYIVLHWGGNANRAPGPNYQAFYIGDFDTDSSYTFHTTEKGLSSYSLFSKIPENPRTPVPDGGSSAGLLGFALLGLVAGRKLVLKKK